MIHGAVPQISFSLVICTHNRARLLRDTLATALRQRTVADDFRYEVIVVDNNSTDDTRSVVTALLPEHGGLLRYVFEPRQGKSYALNTALERLAGDYYTIVDDDFLLPGDWLLGIREGIRRHPDASFLAGKALPCWSSPPPAWLTPAHWSALGTCDFGAREFRSTSANRVCLLACTFRTADVRAVGGYDVTLGVRGGEIGGVEDLELLTRLWNAGREGVYLPDVAFEHRVEADRLTKRYHRRWHRGHGRSYALMRDPETERGTVRLLGVPSYMYRELLDGGGAWLAHKVMGRPSAAFVREARLWFLIGFLRQRWRAPLAFLHSRLS